MKRNEAKAKSVRKPLRDVTNGGGLGRLSKSVNAKKKLGSEKKINKENTSRVQERGDDRLDRLLLVQSNLSSQVDELVSQAFQLKANTKDGRTEIEAFSNFLSDMLSSLKPWEGRFQKVLSGSSTEDANIVPDINDDENLDVESPEQTKLESMVSPSPLVSWRADCNVERGRQLFLLTPLPLSKTLSFKRQELSKSVFASSCSGVELPSVLTISGDANDDLLEGVKAAATTMSTTSPCKQHKDSVVADAKTDVGCGVAASPMFSKGDHSMLLMTPCLKMSPPKSCVLLEPISESTRNCNERMRKSTPFPVGIHSYISGSSSSEGSEDLAFQYPELLGIQQVYKSRMGKKELDASPNWSFSPPKTCVLLEPPDEISPDTGATEYILPGNAPAPDQPTNWTLLKENDVQGGCLQIKKSCNEAEALTLVESTPMWKEPESTLRTGALPGENTLKRELWTKFEAATSYGFRINTSVLQRTARKDFLDRLEEASCDIENPVADDFR